MQKHNDQQNGFLNIFINILIPVMILNKGSKFNLTPQLTVIIALSFPLIYGLYSLAKTRKVNFISLLGLINILVSGTLTILALGGIWFAIKEAFFPLLIGVFVFLSSFGKNPFFESLFLNPAAFQVDKINLIITERKVEKDFQNLIVESTRWLSLSFLMSAILNFALALYVFKPIDDSLPLETRQTILNEQLGQMTLYSTMVILIPSVLFLGAILYFAFKKIKQITGLELDDLFVNQ